MFVNLFIVVIVCFSYIIVVISYGFISFIGLLRLQIYKKKEAKSNFSYAFPSLLPFPKYVCGLIDYILQEYSLLLWAYYCWCWYFLFIVFVFVFFFLIFIFCCVLNPIVFGYSYYSVRVINVAFRNSAWATKKKKMKSKQFRGVERHNAANQTADGVWHTLTQCCIHRC